MCTQRQSGCNLAATGNSAGGQHGHAVATGLDHLGHQHHGGNLASVTARLGALGHDHIDTSCDVAHRVLGFATQGANQDTAITQLGHHVRRRRT